jgi:hypothetical protein
MHRCNGTICHDLLAVTSGLAWCHGVRLAKPEPLGIASTISQLFNQTILLISKHLFLSLDFKASIIQWNLLELLQGLCEGLLNPLQIR